MKKSLNIKSFLTKKKKFLHDQIKLRIDKREEQRNLNYLIAQIHLVEQMQDKFK